MCVEMGDALLLHLFGDVSRLEQMTRRGEVMKPDERLQARTQKAAGLFPKLPGGRFN